MKKNIEVIFDTTPSGGCGCNCGCSGSTVIEDMNEFVNNLKEYDFKTDLNIDVLTISEIEQDVLISKINTLLDNTNATFRVDTDNMDETLKELLPLVALDGKILTAYGVPTLYDVVSVVEKSL